MRTRVVRVTRDMPEWDAIMQGAEVIGGGGIVCFPTDTVYGFGASIFSERAVERLRAIKSRGRGIPFVIIVDDIGWVHELARKVTRVHRRLMAEHWPGPLTIVFETSASLPEHVTRGQETVALRVPNDTLSQCLLRACGVPLAAPSANPRGKVPALSADEALEYFGGQFDLLLDGGVIENAEPSTIVAVKSGRVVVVREGRVSMSGSAI